MSKVQAKDINLEPYKELLEGNPTSIATVSTKRERERERESMRSSELVSRCGCESRRYEPNTHQPQRDDQNGRQHQSQPGNLPNDLRPRLEGCQNVRPGTVPHYRQMAPNGQEIIYYRQIHAKRRDYRNSRLPRRTKLNATFIIYSTQDSPAAASYQRQAI